MNKEELLAEAKKKYPIGCSFKSLYQNSNEIIYVVNHDKVNELSDGIWLKGNNEPNNKFHARNGLVYQNNNWAKIVSYPENYVHSTENLLNNLIIW